MQAHSEKLREVLALCPHVGVEVPTVADTWCSRKPQVLLGSTETEASVGGTRPQILHNNQELTLRSSETNNEMSFLPSVVLICRPCTSKWRK